VSGKSNYSAKKNKQLSENPSEQAPPGGAPTGEHYSLNGCRQKTVW